MKRFFECKVAFFLTFTMFLFPFPVKAQSIIQCLPVPSCDYAYNPPAYSKNDADCDTLTLRADFLWWRAFEEGTVLGETNFFREFTDFFGRTIVRDISRVKELEFHYEPGFRLGLEKKCAFDNWGVSLNWTHFHSKAAAHVDIGALSEQTIFVSFWERGDDLFPVSSKADWKLNIDLIDLEIERKYYVSSSLVLRPYFGLRGARITQTYLVASKANNLDNLGESDSFISRSKSRCNLLAIGPRVGLDAEFDILCGISFFGQAASSLVFGRFDRHSKEYNREFTSEISDTYLEFYYQSKNGLHRCSHAMTDLAIGLKWDGCVEFCNHLHPTQILFAWEQHMFYSLSAFDFASEGLAIRSLEFTRRSLQEVGDLSTQGLTVSIQMNF